MSFNFINDPASKPEIINRNTQGNVSTILHKNDKEPKPEPSPFGHADQDYWLDAYGRLTTDLEVANSLLIRKGQIVPEDVHEKYGLGKKGNIKP